MTPGARDTGELLRSVATPSTIRSPACEYIFAARRAGESDGPGASMSWCATTSGLEGLLKRSGTGGTICPTPIALSRTLLPKTRLACACHAEAAQVLLKPGRYEWSKLSGW